VTSSTVPILTDDVDGTELRPGQGQTVYFSFESNDYTIDLSDENYEKFAAEIEVWASKAFQPAGESGQRRARARARRSSARAVPAVDRTHLRRWARANGYPVSARGRLPGQIHAAYAAAH